jgi:hypothetical protein
MNIFKGAKMSLSKFNIWREGMGNDPVGNQPIDENDLDINEEEELKKLKSNEQLSAAAKQVITVLKNKLHTFTKNPKIMSHFLKEIIKSVMDAAGVTKVSQGVRTDVINTLNRKN